MVSTHRISHRGTYWNWMRKVITVGQSVCSRSLPTPKSHKSFFKGPGQFWSFRRGYRQKAISKSRNKTLLADNDLPVFEAISTLGFLSVRTAQQKPNQ